ncbi:MAG: alpha/beta hydrolase [Bacteroidia bacterium]
MRIKESLNKELQSTYRIGKTMSYLLRKNWGVKVYNRLIDSPSRGKSTPGIQCEELTIPSRNQGPDIRTRVFRPKNVEGPLPGMLFLHGGGFIVGTPEQFFDIIKEYIKTRPCIIVAPDYRKALAHPFPDGFNDCYDSLLWMRDFGESVNIDTSKLIIAGHSAGGGLAVAVSMKARDTRDAKLQFQIPIYPMLDDRQQTASMLRFKGSPMWDNRNTRFAWEHYLKRLVSASSEIPSYASPSRSTDFSNLPPAITFFGSQEPFHDEVMNYIKNLDQQGIPVSYKIVPGAYHGFEMVKPEAKISVETTKFLMNNYAAFYDKYL